MMKINLLRHFPHRIMHHQMPDGTPVAMCIECCKTWTRVPLYKEPKPSLYDRIFNWLDAGRGFSCLSD